MEKCRLKIKLKAPAIRRETNNVTPNGGGASLPLGRSAVTETGSLLKETSRNMKRKRGHKKGKKKKPTVVDGNESALKNVSLNMEDNSPLDDPDSSPHNSVTEVEAGSFKGMNLLTKLTNAESGELSDKPAGRSGHGRVKVKLKSSKILESHQISSDAQTQSDTDKSGLHTGVERQGEIPKKIEDSANSRSEMHTSVSGGLSRKAGSIKIKSRGLGSSSATMNQMSSILQVQSERTPQTASNNFMTVESSTSKDLPHHDPRYNKGELQAALLVIKKVMKMDAAEPFNVPVNPDVLGIPDYFDVIDTPMDFGTICSNLEHGNKYTNSEDVLKDVEYIWENCYRYNNKGDYILDLMKRVKKSFTKYWMVSGLYTDQSKINNDAVLYHDPGRQGLHLEDNHGRDITLEGTGRKTNKVMSKQEAVGAQSVKGNGSIQVETLTPPDQEKIHAKGNHKTRRRHGINHHKSDCLCAVCVVRRRRQEREGNVKIVENQTGMSDGNLSQDFKLEGTSPLDTPGSEDASSNLDHSPDHPDADADLEGEEMQFETSEQQYSPPKQREMTANEMVIQKKGRGDLSRHIQLADGSEEEPNQSSGAEVVPEEKVEVQQHDHDLLQKQEECHQRTKKHEKIPSIENPLILNLCGTLFPSDPKSVWSGPHSLANHRLSVHNRNPFHAAVSMFRKPF